jgi:hypothetical protein
MWYRGIGNHVLWKSGTTWTELAKNQKHPKVWSAFRSGFLIFGMFFSHSPRFLTTKIQKRKRGKRKKKNSGLEHPWRGADLVSKRFLPKFVRL